MGDFEDYYRKLQGQSDQVKTPNNDFNTYYEGLQAQSRPLNNNQKHALDVEQSDMAQMEQARRASNQMTQTQMEPQQDPGAADGMFREQQSAIPIAEAQREKAGEYFDSSAVGRGIRDYVFEPFAAAIDNAPKLFGLPVKETRKASDAFGEMAGSVYTPGGTIKNIAGATQALGGAATKLLPNLSAKLSSTLGGRVAQGALREGALGAPLTSANYLAQGNNQLDEAAKEGVYGAAFGGALGAAGPVAGKGIQALGTKYTGTKIGDFLNRFFEKPAAPAPEPLALPLGRGTERINAAQQRGILPSSGEPIAPEYQFKLPEGTEQTSTRMNNISDAQSGLKEIDNELNLLQSKYQQAIHEQYAFLKNAREERGGVTQGQLHKDSNGDVVGRTGRISNNPEWYQQFYAENGRVPTNRDLYRLAQKHVDEGYSDSGVQIPSWKTENSFDDTVFSLNSVREQVNKGLRELDPGTTDAPLKDNVLKFNPTQRSEARPTAVMDTPTVKPVANIDESLLNAALPPKQSLEPATQPVQRLIAAPDPVTESSTGIRGNYKNQLDNGKFSDELQSGIRNTDQTYEPLKNRDSVAAANENVKDLSAAESKFIGNKDGGAEHIATGYRLMQEFDKLGDPERALNIANKLAKDLTKAGQTVQAASVLTRLSPEGQLLNLVRTAERNGKEVSAADSVKFKELAAKVQERTGAGKNANEFNEILNRMEKGENVGADDLKKLSNYISGAEKVVKPKPEVVYELPKEFKDVRKRDKIVSYLDDVEQAALARIASRKGRMNSLVLPDLREFRDHTIVVASQTAKGTIKAATHVEDMVKLFGEEIRPVATQVFQGAQKLITGVSRGAAEGNFERAGEALRRMSGEAEAEKAIVEETANHVRKLIADAKAGKLDPADVQKLRDYSDEIVDSIKDKKPGKLPTQEERFLQSVKALAKKVAKLETEKVPADQANREVSSLLRQITKIADEGKPIAERQPLDNKALSKIAYDVLEKTKPSEKEKILERYIRQRAKIGENVSPRDIEVLRKLANDVTRLSGDQKFDADLAMQKILNSYEQSSMYDKILTVRYIGMLWNTSTQLINASSGASRAVMGTLEDLPAYMLDRLANAVTGSKRNITLYNNNPLKLLAGMLKNAPKGMRSGWHGTNPGGITSIDDVRGLVFKNNDTPRPLRGLRELAKKPAQLLERSLGAVAKGADYAVYKSIADNDLIQQAYLSAKNAKIKGDTEIKEHMAKFLESPPPEALMQADNVGKNATFQRMDTAGGKTATSLNRLPLPLRIPVNIAAPFIKTPLNILSAGATYTPYGALKGITQLISPTAKASNREALRNIGASIIGSGIMAPVGFYLNSIGVITGANDSGDKDVNAIRAQAGQDKYKLNTSALSRYMMAMFEGEGIEGAEKAANFQKGDMQIDYNKFQPLALLPAVGASIHENKDKPMGELISNVGNDALGSFTSMSMLKGVQGLLAPEYSTPQGEATAKLGTRFAEAAVKTFSPSIVAQEARRQDPIQRKTAYNEDFWKDVSDYYKSRTPGLSKTLPAMKTTLGEDKRYATGVIGQFLNPFKSEEIPYNEAAKIITDLIDRTGNKKLAPAAPDKKVTGKKGGVSVSIELEPKRYAQLQEEVGKEIIDKVTALPEIMTDAKKMEQIEKIYAKARERAANKAKRELGIRVQ